MAGDAGGAVRRSAFRPTRELRRSERRPAGMTRARLAVFLLAVLLPLLAGCGEPVHKQQSFVFGTLVEVTVYGVAEETARDAVNQVLRDLDAQHRALHAWQAGPLDGFNERLAAAPASGEVPRELLPLLLDAARLAELSGHLFNPAIGNLVRLWGFHADTFVPRLPDAGEIARLVAANPRMDDIDFDVAAATFVARNPAVRIDLGGYAKGWALDRAAATLRARGVEHALVNIGGNIIALGARGDRAWRVGIQDPRASGALATVELRDGEAIGTSGDYQRFFEIDGRRYCHLIDPRSGWPVQHTRAVTVIARGPGAGVLSDVASKPLFIAGPAEWRRLADTLGISEAMRIDADGGITVSRALHGRLMWDNRVRHDAPLSIVD